MSKERKIVMTYLSLGGGVQSGTLAEMMVNGDLPKADYIVFADTGDEPQYVYDYVDYLRKRIEGAGIEFHRVGNRNLYDDVMNAETRGGDGFVPIPVYGFVDGKKSVMRRACTYNYKIHPIEQLARKKLLEYGFAKESTDNRVYVHRSVAAKVLIGISLDEYQRMRTSRTPFIVNEYPLIDRKMTRQDCINYLHERDLPIPGKSSCRFCPYHEPDYFLKMKQSEPKDFDAVVDLDRSLRDERAGRFAATGQFYLSYKRIPIDEVVKEYEEGRVADDEESGEVCEGGYCFV